MRPPGWIEPDYGPVLGAELINLPNGPLLGGQLPGGITRWMAVPWQTDTASCRSGYLKSYDPYVPTFWPARVPNQILTRADYEVVFDPEQPLADRLAAFARRASWLRPLGSTSYTDQINNMIAHFDHMGVVEPRRGPDERAIPENARGRGSAPGGARARRGSRSTRGRGTRPVGHRQGAPISARPAAPTRLIRAEVLILGGGPAGAIAALNLAPMRRVVLVERREQPAPRIGEALPPAARRLLTDMGLIDEFVAQGHAPCYGNRSIWGQIAPAETDFVRDPDGHGWHLDRARFDTWLRRVGRGARRDAC